VMICTNIDGTLVSSVVMTHDMRNHVSKEDDRDDRQW
jgi:hypothetical protein